jgi:O-acetyl-ADP-ribose deacetylase (regulator of RNase III)
MVELSAVSKNRTGKNMKPNHEDRIEVIKGDITLQKVDAIVNAANSSLLGGGGVDGAIHRAAGPELLEECRKLRGCPTGAARITKGYKLPAHWVIHTVGPVWRGGTHDEERLLAQCYRSCFELAKKFSVRSIAFPSISTGAYGFPVTRASRIAINEIKSFLEQNAIPEKVLLVCFDAHTYETYLSALE